MTRIKFSFSTVMIFIFCLSVLFINLLTYQGGFSATEPIHTQVVPEGDLTNPYTNQGFLEILSAREGEIPILMYHNILTPALLSNEFALPIPETLQRYYVTSDEFRLQLKELYDAGFVNISLDEYLSLKTGEVNTLSRVAPGKKLYVLTFDDATYGQFDFSGTDASGNPVIDTNCAVGMMIEFAKQHPDFKLNAAFSVDFENTPFMDAGSVEEKLNLLLDYGFEVVNHTATHCYLANYIAKNPDKVSEEIGKAMEYFESYLGYRAAAIDKLCYPGGKENDALYEFVQEVTYNGKVYRFNAALDAEGYSALNPANPDFNAYDIDRIEVNNNTFDPFVLNAPGLFAVPALSVSMR